MASGGAAVSVEGLTWRPYGRRDPVLDDVTLHLPGGQHVLLVGASGSGKSTLLRALAGLLLTADSGDLTGSVSLDDGRGPSEPQALAGRVGLVLQDPGAGIVAASLARDVAFGLENLGVDPAAMPAAVTAALREVRLDHLPPAVSPATLSGGEQQRLALAGALALAPSLLLLDEPLAMLDAETAETVRDVVVEVATRRGLTLVVVEHRLDPWLPHVDRLVVLGPQGRTVADGRPATVLAQQGDDLAAAGIWVPGHPDPQPVAPPVAWAAARVPRGAVAARGDRVTVRHTTRSLSGTDRVTTAVVEADLAVPAGTTTALVGPSGAGKSTLLTALGGLVAPTSGRVDWADEMTASTGTTPPHRLAPVDLARQVAWVPQRAATTLLRRTVREEVLATSEAVGLDLGVATARADVLLAHLGLGALASADPRTLSGGEQRRLAVAAAVLHQPALVLADEPTVGQDRLTWAAVLGILESVRVAGSAVLVTTHDAGVVARADAVHRLTRPPHRPEDDERPPRPLLVDRCGPLSLLLVALLAVPLPVLLQSWRAAVAVLVAEALLAVVALAAPPGGRARTSPAPAGASDGCCAGSWRRASPRSASAGRRGCSGGTTSRWPSPRACACSPSSCPRRSCSPTSTPTRSATTSPAGCTCPHDPSSRCRRPSSGSSPSARSGASSRSRGACAARAGGARSSPGPGPSPARPSACSSVSSATRPSSRWPWTPAASPAPTVAPGPARSRGAAPTPSRSRWGCSRSWSPSWSVS